MLFSVLAALGLLVVSACGTDASPESTNAASARARSNDVDSEAEADEIEEDESEDEEDPTDATPSESCTTNTKRNGKGKGPKKPACTPTTPPVCGDGVCDPAAEDCQNCEADCGACETGPVCGDGVCDPAAEDCQNCEADCGACPPVCGDGVCDPAAEDCQNCEADCGACPPVCGDGVCDPAAEDCQNCEADCGACPPVCGDGVCDPAAEDCQNCEADCGACGPTCEPQQNAANWNHPFRLGPGTACGNCHNGQIEFNIEVGGTLFADANGQTPVAGGTILLHDAGGNDIKIISNSEGHFYTRQAVQYPLQTEASLCPDFVPMFSPVNNGDCNSCHFPGSGFGGTVHVP